MKLHTLELTTLIKRPLSEVFDFFSKAEHLNLLTPPELSFSILTPLPVFMQQGTLINYRIKLYGIPFSWKTEICEWNPPHRFEDRQLNGPYAHWHHSHIFTEKDGFTEMVDRIEFRSPGWVLEPLINALFVERKVKEIFEYRKIKLTEYFV